MKLMKNNKKESIKEIIKSVVETAVCVALILGLFTYIVVPVRIQGSSMENTLHDGNIAFINAIGSRNGHVERFDVVVLYSDQLEEKIIKRVIGLPGDHIVYREDKLYINDEYIEEVFLDEEFKEYSKNQYSVSLFTNDFEADVGENEIFVMGDNRQGSTDSRSEMIGFIREEYIFGVAKLKLFNYDKENKSFRFYKLSEWKVK